MPFSSKVKSFLLSVIRKMAESPELYAKNPDSDFTRERKLGFEKLIQLIIAMGSGTIGHELLKFFDYDVKVLSVSAFIQQRKKLLVVAFQSLLISFTSHFPSELYMGKYILAACDGSEFNIARNPNDPKTFHPSNGQSPRGFNMLHTVSLFDILNKRYLDCVVQPGRKKNEFRAICDLIDRYSYCPPPIIIADRGFASYNVFAHAINKGVFFLIRAKDINVKRLLNMETLPDRLNKQVDIILTRTNSKKKWRYPEMAGQYRYISSEVSFDYIEHKSGGECPLSLRIVRFEVKKGVCENIITNLPVDEFPVDEISKLYHLRWGIETSFRDLKHIVGATNFHSKKPEYIEQEIWARLILYNFCAIITSNIVVEHTDRKHMYKVNFAMAIKICHNFMSAKIGSPPPDVESLIGRYLLPIRLGRNYARQHRFQLPASFCYRFS